MGSDALPRGERDAQLDTLALPLRVAEGRVLADRLPVALPLREAAADAETPLRDAHVVTVAEAEATEGDGVPLWQPVADTVAERSAVSLRCALGLALFESKEGLALALPVALVERVALSVKEAVMDAAALDFGEGLPPAVALPVALAESTALRLPLLLPVALNAVDALSDGEAELDLLAAEADMENESSAVAVSGEADEERLCSSVEVAAALNDVLKELVEVAQGESEKLSVAATEVEAAAEDDCALETLSSAERVAEGEPVTETVPLWELGTLAVKEALLEALREESVRPVAAPLSEAALDTEALGHAPTVEEPDRVPRKLREPRGSEAVAEPLAEADTHVVAVAPSPGEAVAMPVTLLLAVLEGEPLVERVGRPVWLALAERDCAAEALWRALPVGVWHAERATLAVSSAEPLMDGELLPLREEDALTLADAVGDTRSESEGRGEPLPLRDAGTERAAVAVPATAGGVGVSAADSVALALKDGEPDVEYVALMVALTEVDADATSELLGEPLMEIVCVGECDAHAEPVSEPEAQRVLESECVGDTEGDALLEPERVRVGELQALPRIDAEMVKVAEGELDPQREDVTESVAVAQGVTEGEPDTEGEPLKLLLNDGVAVGHGELLCEGAGLPVKECDDDAHAVAAAGSVGAEEREADTEAHPLAVAERDGKGEAD